MKYTSLTLHGRVTDDISWDDAQKACAAAIEKGESILWKLDLGLFSELPHPLSHRSQFLSLQLSCQHFVEAIWQEHKEHSLGVVLYEGPADYAERFFWDEEQANSLQEWLKGAFPTIEELAQETGLPLKSFQEATPEVLAQYPSTRRLISLFCRDVCLDYIHLLGTVIPDEIPLFACLDTEDIDDLALKAQLTSQEKYERIALQLPPVEEQACKIAFCLPPSSFIQAQAVAGLHEAMQALAACGMPFKIIPEESLITEWDGLDHLVVCAHALGPQGRRKLQGFCAAGGEVITLGNEQLHLPSEIEFTQWIEARSS